MEPSPALGAATRTLMRLPAIALRRIAGPAKISDRGEELDLQIQVLLRLMELADLPTTDQLNEAEARANLEADIRMVDPSPPQIARVESRFFRAPDGPMPLRIYRPRAAAEPLPVLLFFHGGGFVTGSPTSHDGACRRLALAADCLIVSVHYRLAPENPFPAAVEDAMDAFRWAVDNAARLGGDPERIAVGGDSAGGNLSTVVSRLLRDEPGPQPCFQLMIYPATDLTRSYPSHRTLGEGYFLTTETIDWYLSRYAPEPAQQTDPRASPLFEEDLSGLPPALMVTAGFDPLRDEGDAYVERLREDGVSVEHQHEPGMIHGFFNLTPIVRGAADAFDRLARTTHRALHG